MFKALSRQNAARFQRPPAARVRAPVLSVLHKLMLSQMSCGINGSLNPLHALITTRTQRRCALINSEWFCKNVSVLCQKLCQLQLSFIPMRAARARLLVMRHFFKAFYIKSHRLLLFIVIILLTTVIGCNSTKLWRDLSQIVTTKFLFSWSIKLSDIYDYTKGFVK